MQDNMFQLKDVFYDLVDSLLWLFPTMANLRNIWLQTAAFTAGFLRTAKGDSLKDIDHVVLFMQGAFHRTTSSVRIG